MEHTEGHTVARVRRIEIAMSSADLDVADAAGADRASAFWPFPEFLLLGYSPIAIAPAD